MKICHLFLYSYRLKLEKEFYSKILGFKIFTETKDSFTLKIGWSKLTFIKSDKVYKYHYCFLIPSNKLKEALIWMEKRVTILQVGNNKKTQRFDSWNADSFYFYDACGNVAEFIVRHDLNNPIESSFKIEEVICINEIGLPTKSIHQTDAFLKKELGSSFWKGDKLNFGTNGSQEGLFLLPNYKTRTEWFPTKLKIEPSPFKAKIENNNILYNFEFLKETIKIERI